MIDYVVIGSGIVGSFIAWELSKHDLKVLLLEKESDIANGQTIANSGIIHSGHDPKEDTLKALLCVKGNQLYKKYEHPLQIPLRKTGAYVLAYDDHQLKELHILKERAHYNGVLDATLLTKSETLTRVPQAFSHVLGSLSLPSTMVTFPWKVCYNLIQNAMDNGLEVGLNKKVTDIKKEGNTYIVEVNHTAYIHTKGIINASGVHSDTVAAYLETPPFKIIPRRGEYFVLDHSVAAYLNHVIYPIPTKAGKGVILTPQVHGNILIGPNAEIITEKEATESTQHGLAYVKEKALTQLKDIPFHANIRTFSGIRASSDYEDFYIKESIHKNVYHLGGMDSPGLTAAPAIALYLIDLIKVNQPLTQKEVFKPLNIEKKPFKELNTEEKQALIFKQPTHGRIVCKCECVTEQDIIDVIHSKLGIQSIKGIKKHTRAGSGLCQGGYCESKIVKLIATHTNKPMTAVDYYEENTPILYKETKVKIG